ncbi:hypothetical protein GE21DRAFT_1095609 [Neurospora crassa]|nr:hypothetical protein GE21DRAFT_1095609 [Neurospora crassa]
MDAGQVEKAERYKLEEIKHVQIDLECMYNLRGSFVIDSKCNLETTLSGSLEGRGLV